MDSDAPLNPKRNAGSIGATSQDNATGSNRCDAIGIMEKNRNEVLSVNPDASWAVHQGDAATATQFACHLPGLLAKRVIVKLAPNV